MTRRVDDFVHRARGFCEEKAWLIVAYFPQWPGRKRAALLSIDNRAVCTGGNKPRITQSAAYVSRELSHLYDNSLHKKLVRSLRKPRTSISCRLHEQFAAYISRGLCNSPLIFPRRNGPIDIDYRLHFQSVRIAYFLLLVRQFNWAKSRASGSIEHLKQFEHLFIAAGAQLPKEPISFNIWTRNKSTVKPIERILPPVAIEHRIW